MNSENPETATPKSSFAKRLATGLIGWALGTVVLFGAAWPMAKPESVSIAAIWTISHWWIPYAFGAVLLIVRGLVSRLSMGTALLAYLLPVALLTGVAGICLLVYPENNLRADLFGYLPLVLLFYFVGFLWMSLAKSGTANTAFLRSVLPAILGGVTVLGLVAVPVFNSNSFIYRNAFGLVISKTAVANGAMVADAVLEVRKPGRYEFTAPRYFYSEYEDKTGSDMGIELGKITWGSAGTPKESVPGTYPLQIRWEKNIPATATELTARTTPEDRISLDVHKPAVESKELIFSIYAPMPEARKE